MMQSQINGQRNDSILRSSRSSLYVDGRPTAIGSFHFQNQNHALLQQPWNLEWHGMPSQRDSIIDRSNANQNILMPNRVSEMHMVASLSNNQTADDNLAAIQRSLGNNSQMSDRSPEVSLQNNLNTGPARTSSANNSGVPNNPSKIPFSTATPLANNYYQNATQPESSSSGSESSSSEDNPPYFHQNPVYNHNSWVLYGNNPPNVKKGDWSSPTASLPNAETKEFVPEKENVCESRPSDGNCEEQTASPEAQINEDAEMTPKGSGDDQNGDSRPHSCNVCGKKFKLSHHLKEHTRIHTGEKPFPCSVCGERFARTHLLRAHQARHVQGAYNPMGMFFPCSKCSKVFESAQHLANHEKKHPVGNLLKCEQCNISFPNLAILNNHKLTHESEDCETPLQECQNNEPKTSTGVEATAPNSEETQPSNYYETNKPVNALWPPMKQTVPDYERIHVHRPGVEDKRPDTSPHVQKGEVSSTKHHNHSDSAVSRQSKTLISPEVSGPEKSEVKPSYNKPWASGSHPAEAPLPPQHQQQQLERSDSVYKGFDMNKLNELYLATSRSLMNANGMLSPQFFNMYGFNKHAMMSLIDNATGLNRVGLSWPYPGLSTPVAQEESHSGTRPRPHQCPHCTKRFKLSHHLREHMRIHTGEKPYTCDLCHERFSRSHLLQRHKSKHIQDMNFNQVTEWLRKTGHLADASSSDSGLAALSASSFWTNHPLCLKEESAPAAREPATKRPNAGESHPKKVSETSASYPNPYLNFRQSAGDNLTSRLSSGNENVACPSHIKYEDVCKTQSQVDAEQYQIDSKTAYYSKTSQPNLVLSHGKSEDLLRNVHPSALGGITALSNRHLDFSELRNEPARSAFPGSESLSNHLESKALDNLQNIDFSLRYAPAMATNREQTPSSLTRSALPIDANIKLKEDSDSLSGDDFGSLFRSRRGTYLQCQFCSKWFADMNNLRQHMVSHSVDRHFNCHKCPKKFKRPHHLKEHMRIHTGEKPYVCDVCDEKFSRSHILQRHRMKHDAPPLTESYVQNLLHKIYDPASEDLSATFGQNRSPGEMNLPPLDSHSIGKPQSVAAAPSPENVDCGKLDAPPLPPQQEMWFDSGQYAPLPNLGMLQTCACPECGKRFANSSNLKQHMVSHFAERLYSCTICDKKFKRPHHLKEHSRTHTGEKPYQCEICHEKFQRSHLLIKHKERHHLMITSSVDTPSSLTDHHPLSLMNPTIENPQLTLHPSSICNPQSISNMSSIGNPLSAIGSSIAASTFSESQFASHPSAARHALFSENPPKFDGTIAPSDYRCNPLSAPCAPREERKAGDLRQTSAPSTSESDDSDPSHSQSEGQTMSCDVCYLDFPSEMSLVVHKRTHPGDRPHSCDGCGKQFALQYLLEIHKKSCK